MAHSSLAHSLTDPHILTCDYFWWPCSFICKIKGLNEISQHPCLDNPSGLWLELFQWKMMMMLSKKKKSCLSLSLYRYIVHQKKKNSGGDEKLIKRKLSIRKRANVFIMYVICINWAVRIKESTGNALLRKFIPESIPIYQELIN